MSERARPRACGECLRRSWLIGSLAGHLDTAVSDTPGNRAREVLALPNEELARAMAGGKAASFIDRAASRDLERIRSAISGAGAWASCRHHELYPGALLELGDAPAVIFGRGDPGLLAGLSREETVTIVGSRRPSGYGRDVARSLGRDVGGTGLAVVSGMAMGIDSCAHEGALEGGGVTIAVLGTGVDVPYPVRSTRLYDEIVERGLVIGELPPGTLARRWTFPARNRIMAALGSMTVVVEARQRSGSLITAEMAQDLNREVGAVPGRVGASPAAGTNGLLHEGAHLIRDAQDVLDALVGTGAGRVIRSRTGPSLDADLAGVLDLVERGAGSADALARAASMEPGTLAAALVRLELSGYVRSDLAGRYERTPLAVPQR